MRGKVRRVGRCPFRAGSSGLARLSDSPWVLPVQVFGALGRALRLFLLVYLSLFLLNVQIRSC